MLTYPHIDPIIVEIGPFALRWYSLAYIAGFLTGLWAMKLGNRKFSLIPPRPELIDDVLYYAIPAVILGGRLAYVCIYNPQYYLSEPWEALKIWHGGMSFHGGMMGLAVALWVYCRRRKVNALAFGGLAALAAPPGLFFGRVANFINGELYGRPTDSPFGMVFPGAGDAPRHPSQLYEAGLEGIALGIVLWALAFALKKTRGYVDGRALIGMFLLGYAAARTFLERFREPDEQIGFLWGSITMGQTLSFPMALVGVALLYVGCKKKATAL
ncbi:MAG: prolipoprotein diacylglyceryl transferase [Rickettsiales bacterium]